jgi:hypothetical protein
VVCVRTVYICVIGGLVVVFDTQELLLGWFSFCRGKSRKATVSIRRCFIVMVQELLLHIAWRGSMDGVLAGLEEGEVAS